MREAARRAAALAGAVLRRRWEDLEAFAFPERCPCCGLPSDPECLLCGRCASGLPPVDATLCARCLVKGAEPSGCGRHRGFHVHAAWLYDERVAALVQAFKYHGRDRLAIRLAGAIAAALPASYRPDLVIHVPLHPARRRERGFDQAALLADALAERLGCPRAEALARVRPTPPQARLGRRQRRENLRGAFRLARPAALARREVLLVDDVVTTGATLEACLSVTAAAGARAAGAAVAWAV